MQYPHLAGFKAPGTSQAAAATVDAKTLRGQVLRTLERCGDLTADEIAHRLAESILSIRPRLSELRALGLVVDSGRRRPNASGRSAIVFSLAPEPMALAA